MPNSIFADRRALIAFATLCCLLWGSAVPAVKFGYGLMHLAPGDTPPRPSSSPGSGSASPG